MLKIIGLREAVREVNRVAERSRFAGVVALTRTARDAAGVANAETERYLDRPTRFTKTAFVGLGANARDRAPEAAVIAKDTQAEYLKYAVFGGQRRPEGPALLDPVDARLNRFGNLPRGYVRRLLNRQDTFSGRPESGRTGRYHGPAGIYQRVGRGRRRRLRLLVGFDPEQRYRRRFPFFEIANRAALERWAIRYDEALRQYLRSR